MVRADLTCVVCTNSDLVFSRRDDSKAVLVECRECLTGYLDPRNLDNGLKVRMESVPWTVSHPTAVDLRSAGLGDLIAD